MSIAKVARTRKQESIAPQPIDADLRAVPKKPLIQRLLAHTATWVFLVDVALILAFGLLSEQQSFWSLANIQSLLLGGTQALLLALGLALLLGAGVFDFSLGANLVLSSVTGGLTVQAIAGPYDPQGVYSDVGYALLAGFVVAIVTGTLFGLANGLIISLLDINPLIATLGTMGIGTGIALVITNGGNISGLPSQIQSAIGLNMIGGVLPLPTLVALVVAALVTLLLKYTRFGMRSLAMGSSRTAAERAGIKTRRQTIQLTMIAGAFAGLAGYIDLARFGSTSASGHTQDALNAIAAVIIGGTLLVGGRVSILGAIFGTILAVVLQTGLVIIGVQAYWQLIAVGAVLIIAIAIDRFRYTLQKA
ncbi:hypothetical protein AU252_10085 [Pseudarthrobacter sulfonivorans]|uniref:ABC transporter permease n=1 Tax=Pseudarthrobacter sulfonivorans TaxID=121292 RepID=A0A0U3NX93_9MICC|nr:ABC transporter permease [Pseudarthrobacter sulfonivorans]ALV41455.1 hypothetical protein AU252_10085 [Pseudarthrobacter sulfonivorans]